MRNKIDIKDWSVDDVIEWISFLNLSQYADVFKANEIAGPILLDISLEDLDYMDIKVLGHRKLILKGIEDLRKNKRVTITIEQTHSAPSTADSNSKGLLSRSVDLEQATKVDAKLLSSSMSVSNLDSAKVHWSHVKPIAENEVGLICP